MHPARRSRHRSKGAAVPAHLQKSKTEAHYVVDGDCTNEVQAGISLNFKGGNGHGPHTSKNGCSLLILWTERTSKESADLRTDHGVWEPTMGVWHSPPDDRD
jgi:hypothetical protein